MNELTQRGITALRAGDRITARKLLASAVQQDMNDMAAWLWLAGALEGDEERITCLRQVLRLDPGNQAAARGLAQILERRTRPASRAAEPSGGGGAPAVVPPAVQSPEDEQPAAAHGGAAIYEEPASKPSASNSTVEPPAPIQSASNSTVEPPAPIYPASTSTVEPPAPDAWRGLTWDTASEGTASEGTASEGTAAEPAAGEISAADFAWAETDASETDVYESYTYASAVEAPTVGEAQSGGAEVFEIPEPAPAAETYAYDLDITADEALSRAADTAVSEPAAPVTPENSAAAAQPRKRSQESHLPMRRIFTTRPSLVPSLLFFWLFFFGTVYAGNTLAKNEFMQTRVNLVPQAMAETLPRIQIQASTLFALAMGLILELTVIYATLRIFTIRYELTNQMLTVRFRGKRARVPIEYIYNAECKQSFIQKAIGTGHVDLDLAVNGELAHVRLRDIPDCKKRREQIMYLVQDLA